MLNIRLSRVGKRNYAQYKIVVAEKTAPIKGKFVEQLGSYDPHSKQIIVKKDRIKHWLSQGAGCSETMHNLLVEHKIIEENKRILTLKAKKSTDNKTEESVSTKDNKGGKKDENNDDGEVKKTEDAKENKDKSVDEKKSEEDAKNTSDNNDAKQLKKQEKNEKDSDKHNEKREEQN